MSVQVQNHNLQNDGFDASDVLTLVPSYCQAIASVSDGDNRVPIALLLPRGLSLCAAEFAVLRLKRFFLPIDPANPLQRIETILQDASAEVLVVDRSTKHLANELSCANVVDLSEISAEGVQHEATTDLEQLIDLSPDDLAYMIYTSGSTGRPKGVPIHWAGLDNHNQWFCKEFGLSPDDRCTELFSPGFDVSIQDVFPVLRSGASLYPVNKDLLTDPYKFFQWIEDSQLTVLSFPTALWHTLVPILSKRPLPESVRLVLIGGEQVNSQLVEQWFSSVDSNRVRLVNMYGPTEVSIASAFCELSPEQTSAIGKPIDNIQIHLVDEDANLVTEPDIVGELVLSGVGVARGYWNRAEETESSFFHSDLVDGKWSYRSGDLARFDDRGDLVFVGRKDGQVKLRGFRIELDEIALAVSSHPKIEDAVVKKVGQEDRELLACFAVSGDTNSEDDPDLEKSLRNHLQDLLPEYMIPTAFKFVSQFPVTVGGKVDAAKLLGMLDRRDTVEDSQVAATETERIVCKVWKEVLGHNPDSRDVTFAACGGDSLTAMSFVLRLEEQFDLKGLGLAALAVHDTVPILAAHIDDLSSATDTDLSQPLVTYLPSTDAKEDQPCLLLFHPAGGSGYFYYDLFDEDLLKKFSIVIVESPLLTNDLPPEKPTINQIAQDYFSAVTQHLDVGQPVVAAGYSFGGLLAWEFAQLLQQESYEVRQVINIDQPVPSEIRNCGIGKRLSNWLIRLKHPGVTLQDLIRVNKLNGARTASQNTEDSQTSELIHSTNVEDFYRAIEQDYEPSANSLDMTLIRGEIFLAKFELPQGYGWSKITKNLRTVDVSGSHSTLFHERFIGRLREAFLTSLK